MDKKLKPVCANQPFLEVTGWVNLSVNVGKTEVEHTFYFIPSVEHQLILGNDLLYKVSGKINTRYRVLELPGQNVVQLLCISTVFYNTNTANLDNARELPSDATLILKATEKPPLLPVVRDQHLILWENLLLYQLRYISKC